MALIGNDFVAEKVPYRKRCGECGRVLEKGSDALVSRRFGKVQKRVCSEECRLTFDDKFWRACARRRVARNPR